MENIKLEEGFTQVCVWPGTSLDGEEDVFSFIEWMKNTLVTRVQYLEQIETYPDLDDVSGNSGGRNDLFFAVHADDVMKFAVLRLQFGIRWVEDVYFNNQGYLYPERVEQYKSW